MSLLNKETHPQLLERCDHAMFDKGYDSTARICDLWDLYGIKAIIDIKICGCDIFTLCSHYQQALRSIAEA